MADNKHTVTPLFNKMDAFLARHRGQSGQEIPVLTQEASLTPPKSAAPNNNGLMFNPHDFYSSPNPDVSALEVKLPPAKPKPIDPLFSDSLFLDLPILDFGDMADNPLGLPKDDDAAIPTLAMEASIDPLELEIDAPQADIKETIDPIEALGLELEEEVAEAPIAHSDIELEAAPTPLVMAAPAFEPAPMPQAEEEIIELSSAAYDEAYTEEEITLSAPVNEQDEEIHLSLVEGFSEHPMELTLEHTPAELAQEAAEQEAAEQALNHIVPEPALQETAQIDAEPVVEIAAEAFIEQAIEIAAPPVIEAIVEAAPEPAPAPAPAPAALKLSDANVAEITASVGAHLAVEISTEVAHLTRQHFSQMMDKFYKDALRKMTEEIAREMDSALAPRIEQMVQEELRRQGFID